MMNICNFNLARRAARLGWMSLGTTFYAATALAQTSTSAGAPAAVSGLEEVVVTARRREENIQDVPVSVTAVSGDQLQQRGIQTAMDLGKLAPSLVVTQSPRGSNTPYFVIRGQRLIDTTLTIDPVTVIYTNEIPYMRPQGLNGGLFDIQSVQVLRGPQGTLFGRNTTGGAVLVTTNPATDRFEGNVGVRAGDFGMYGVDGAVNLPMGEKVALRLAGTDQHRDGYMTNRATGYKENELDYHAGRVTLALKPTSSLTSTFYGNYYASNTSGTSNQIFSVVPAVVQGLATQIGQAAAGPRLVQQMQNEIALNNASPYTYGSDMQPQDHTETWDVSNTTVWELNSALSIKNILGYRDVATHSEWDLDGTQYFLDPQSGPIFEQLNGDTSVHQISEELQLLGTGTNFDWLVGAFYFHEKGRDVATSIQGGDAQQRTRPSGIYAENKSYSVFASGTYRFSLEGLSLSAGVRETRDERFAYAHQQIGAACGFNLDVTGPKTPTQPNGPLISPPCLFPEEASFTQPSWSLSLNYKLNDQFLVYLAHRHGYRSGGVQNRATRESVALTNFNPEKVNDIELGTKSDFNIGSMQARVNADVYYAKYDDLQRLVSFVANTGTLVSGLFNAAASDVKGAELELTLLPVRGLQLQASAGYVDPKYKEFKTFFALGTPTDISYAPFAQVPKWTVNGGVAYTQPLPSTLGSLQFTYDYRYQSEIHVSDVPEIDPNADRLPGFSVSDARVGWNDIAGSTVAASVFVTNVFDKTYFTYGTNPSLGMNTRQVAPPRMWGAEARVKF